MIVDLFVPEPTDLMIAELQQILGEGDDQINIIMRFCTVHLCGHWDTATSVVVRFALGHPVVYLSSL